MLPGSVVAKYLRFTKYTQTKAVMVPRSSTAVWRPGLCETRFLGVSCYGVAASTCLEKVPGCRSFSGGCSFDTQGPWLPRSRCGWLSACEQMPLHTLNGRL